MAATVDRYAPVVDLCAANDALGLEQGIQRPAQHSQLNAPNALDDAWHDADVDGLDGNAYDAHAATYGPSSGEKARAVSAAVAASKALLILSGDPRRR